jgi:hypothetical protein
MGAIPLSIAIEELLTVLRQGAAEPVPSVVEHSIEAWLPYYRALPRVLGGHLVQAPHDRAACFYLFARAILDGMAETVRCVLGLPWSRAEFSHTRLLKAFPHLCTAYQLAGETQEVYAYLCELQTRIVEHDGTQAVAHATLHELLTCIEQYLRVVLRFLASNIEHDRASSATLSGQGERRPSSTSRTAVTRRQTRAGWAGGDLKDGTQGIADAMGR